MFCHYVCKVKRVTECICIILVFDWICVFDCGLDSFYYSKQRWKSYSHLLHTVVMENFEVLVLYLRTSIFFILFFIYLLLLIRLGGSSGADRSPSVGGCGGSVLARHGRKCLECDMVCSPMDRRWGLRGLGSGCCSRWLGAAVRSHPD